MTPTPDENTEPPRQISVEEALTLTRDLLRENQLKPAEKMLDALRAGLPDHPDVLHYQGIYEYRCGDSDRAVSLIRQAIATAPARADFHLNLGNILADKGKVGEALGEFEETRRLSPDSAGVWNNLGSIYRLQGRTDEAENAFKRAIELEPGFIGAHINLGGLFQRQGRLERACEHFRKAIDLEPGVGEGYQLLAEALIRRGEREQAAAVLREWLAVEPGNPAALHHYAACGFADAPERATDDYVAYTFDQFAASFENQLQSRLRYRAPQLVVQLLEERLPEPAKHLDILDAGCGTGLCGPLIASWARRLVGVDLSGGMLEKAHAKQCYDLLERAELTRYLLEHDASYDVILSADTLCYFGSLTEVSAAAASALRPGGHFAYTVERLAGPPTEQGFRLEPSGRYVHTRDHVAACLERAGFEEIRIEDAHLRTEGGAPVSGLVAIGRRRC